MGCSLWLGSGTCVGVCVFVAQSRLCTGGAESLRVLESGGVRCDGRRTWRSAASGNCRCGCERSGFVPKGLWKELVV